MSDRVYSDYDRRYQKTPAQVAKRVKRNAARRRMLKAGRVKKGDGKDVDHKDGNTQNNAPSNLRIMRASRNRARK